MTNGDGAALLRQERQRGGDTRVVLVAGLGLIGFASLVLAFGPEISALFRDLSFNDCLAQEAGRYPYDTAALASFCRALISR